MKFENKISYFIVPFFLSTVAPFYQDHKCWDKHQQIGIYRTYLYQIVFVKLKHFIELECNSCNASSPIGIDYNWQTIKMDPNISSAAHSTHTLQLKTGKFKGDIKILENGSLYIRKISHKHSGLIYHCSANGTDLRTDHSLTYDFSYFIETTDEHKFIVGTISKWIHYEQFVIVPANYEIRTINNRAQLSMAWTPWGQCLCNRHNKYSTRRFRMGYCTIIAPATGSRFLKLSLPCHSNVQRLFYPNLQNLTQNILNFKEYKRCMEVECVPEALEEDANFQNQTNCYLKEDSNFLQIKCPGSENSTDILWIQNDDIILNRTANILGNGVKEIPVGVDVNANLNLINVGREKQGYTYSCLVDGLPILKITIVIIPKMIIFTKECAKSLQILTLVMLMSLKIYVCIIYVIIRRRQN